MSRFLADENFPLPVVEELRRLGHDVLTIQEAGRANQQFPDKDVLNFGYKGSELADVLSLSRPTISSYLEKGKLFLDNNKVLKLELSIT